MLETITPISDLCVYLFMGIDLSSAVYLHVLVEVLLAPQVVTGIISSSASRSFPVLS